LQSSWYEQRGTALVDSARTVCIIPARGGSKRIPGKNLAVVGGKSLVGHAVEQALQSRSIGRVIVSTDSDEIADVAGTYGAEIIRRPAELSSDTAISEDVLLHVLDKLEAEEDYVPELLVFLQCTAPIRTGLDIDHAIAVLEEDQADSLLSVVERRMFLWVLRDGRPEPLNYDADKRPRSQDMMPVFLENGSIYVLKPSVLRTYHNRLGGKVSFYVMPPEAVIDVDTPFDLEICRFVFERGSHE